MRENGVGIASSPEDFGTLECSEREINFYTRLYQSPAYSDSCSFITVYDSDFSNDFGAQYW